jgi:hypothetical protein
VTRHGGTAHGRRAAGALARDRPATRYDPIGTESGATRREDSELLERIHVALRELAPTHNVEYRVIDAWA